MNSLTDLIAQREVLEQQINEMRTKARADAIAQALEIIKTHELAVEDLFGKKKGASKAKISVAAKFRNPETNETWSGRGRTPKWLEGKNKEDFAI